VSSGENVHAVVKVQVNEEKADTGDNSIDNPDQVFLVPQMFYNDDSSCSCLLKRPKQTDLNLFAGALSSLGDSSS